LSHLKNDILIEKEGDNKEIIVIIATERKEAILKKMLPPNNKGIPELSKEEGIPVSTLYTWRLKARNQGRLLPNGNGNTSGWSSSDKLSAVIETAPLNESELGKYCRQRGLYPEQIKKWKQACEQANDWDHEENRRLKSEVNLDRKRIKELEHELRRKEKALAETAALLVLKKKAPMIWGEFEGE